LIGLDRPVKPEWIYETLKMIEVGQKPSKYNEPFENIAKELVGKEGKRKVRTVIFRSLIYSMQDSKTTIKNNIFIDWVNKKSLQEFKPLLFFKILMDYEITRFITQKIALCVDDRRHVAVPVLFKKVVQEYGDRDIVKRSLRSFLKTLIHFKILRQLDKNNYEFYDKFTLSKSQTKDFLKLYGKVFLNSQIIDLKNIDANLLFYINELDLKGVANEFNGKEWEYVREIGRELLILKT